MNDDLCKIGATQVASYPGHQWDYGYSIVKHYRVNYTIPYHLYFSLCKCMGCSLKLKVPIVSIENMQW